MRTVMQGLAAFVRETVKVTTMLTGVVAGVLALSIARDEFLSSIGFALAVILLAVLGGILWCANSIALTPRMPIAAGKPQARQALRLLAVGQIGLGLLLSVVYGIDFFTHFRGWSRLPNDTALRDVAVASNAMGLMCLGGILWCAVRVAYPERPTGGSPAPLPPTS